MIINIKHTIKPGQIYDHNGVGVKFTGALFGD